MAKQEWVYLATAPDQLTAELWAELLRGAGVDAQLAPADTASYLGLSPRPCRLLVPRAELAGAREALRRELGPEMETPDG